MKVYRRYLAREIVGATALVLFAFLALFAFFDLVAELDDLGKGGYQLRHALLFVALTLPGRVYELFPIAVLIGSLYALTNLSRHSEITVLRTSGLATGRLLWTLTLIGSVFAILTFLIGEFVAPPAERAAQQLRLRATSSVVGQEFRSGLWIKDERSFVNVQIVLPDTRLRGVRIYEFDGNLGLVAVSEAAEGEYLPPNRWRLTDVVQTRFSGENASVERVPEMVWQSALNPDILAVLLVMPERMSIASLYEYIEHLSENRQRTERYEIALWKKLVYPLASVVMMALALPFALRLHRFGGVSARVFAGIMIGIFFHMLNGLFSNLGIINSWPPSVAALAPSLLFLLAAAGMLWWVERR
ncbi:MAG: putative permease [Proteobacteria bacterium]|jgi:lipopolysaccharide export system permease protein|nr:putative permease [Pseudomonadota bacterium]